MAVAAVTELAEVVEATIKKSEEATKFAKCLGLQEFPRVARNDKRSLYITMASTGSATAMLLCKLTKVHSIVGDKTTYCI